MTSPAKLLYTYISNTFQNMDHKVDKKQGNKPTGEHSQCHLYYNTSFSTIDVKQKQSDDYLPANFKKKPKTDPIQSQPAGQYLQYNVIPKTVGLHNVRNWLLA